MNPVALLFLLAGLSAPGVALAQSGGTPSPAKICADRWNEMKAKNQTGDQTYRDFAARCLSETGAAPATEGKPADGAPAAAPRRHTTPTGASAAAAQPSMKQCADLWSEMKAKNQTGDRTYRDFAQECLAGTGVLDDKPAPSPVEEKSAAPKPRTSMPSVAPRPAPDPAPEPVAPARCQRPRGAEPLQWRMAGLQDPAQPHRRQGLARVHGALPAVRRGGLSGRRDRS
ncbi:hypothetical protein ACFSKM_13120 [Ancylobacter dichloromethanicus]